MMGLLAFRKLSKSLYGNYYPTMIIFIPLSFYYAYYTGCYGSVSQRFTTTSVEVVATTRTKNVIDSPYINSWSISSNSMTSMIRLKVVYE